MAKPSIQKLLWSATRIASALVIVLALFWLFTPRLVASRRASNATGAVQLLRDYVAAQREFVREPRYPHVPMPVYANPLHGQGALDLTEEGDLGLGLWRIPRSSDTLKRSGSLLMRGYVYIHIAEDSTARYDYSRQYGLCAFPAEYPESGRDTFIVNHEGVVYARNLRGKAVTRWPDHEIEAGFWESFGIPDP